MDLAVADGDLRAAFGAAQRVLQILPDSEYDLWRLARLQQQHAPADRAIATYRRLAELRPDQSLVEYNLALLEEKRSQPAAALLHYERAFALKPDLHQAAHHAARLNLQTPTGDPGRALELAARSCELTQNQNYDYLDTLARAFERNGKRDDALDAARRALKLLPPGDPRSERARRRVEALSADAP